MITVESILQKKPNDANKYFDSVIQTEEVNKINLLGLAECAAANATDKFSNDSKLNRVLWAELAEKAYYLYEKLSIEKETLNDVELSIMNMRANLIARYGEDTSITMLDATAIEKWCLDILNKIPKEQLEQAVQDWSVLPVDILRPLRTLKNRLSVCENLFRADRGIKSDAIRSLLSVKDKLP